MHKRVASQQDTDNVKRQRSFSPGPLSPATGMTCKSCPTCGLYDAKRHSVNGCSADGELI